MIKKILILLTMTLTIYSIYILKPKDKITIDDDGTTITIPSNISSKISTELYEISDDLNTIIQDDPMNGYSLGLGTPSLSKKGVKKIYQYLKQKEICIDDMQGYYDLENKYIFYDFWNEYLNKKDTSFIHYSISQIGNIERSDYYYVDDKIFIVYSELDFSNDTPQVVNIYGEQLIDLKYENGYFYYQRVVSELIKMYGGIEYDYIRIEPFGEKNREYTQKYIGTIDYQCTNIFIQDWNEETINKINYSDLLEYLYELKYDKPFYALEFNYSPYPFIKEIKSDFFEQLTQEYLNVSSSNIKKHSLYNSNKDIYYWNEACCVPSKLETPKYVGEVINIEENSQTIVLTVQVHGYAFGYNEGFIHKLSIQKYKNTYKYIANEIIEFNKDSFPQYNPGVTKDDIDV